MVMDTMSLEPIQLVFNTSILYHLSSPRWLYPAAPVLGLYI